MSLLGVPEVIILFALILLVFGPEELPDFARSLRKALTDFKLTVVQTVLVTISVVGLVGALVLLSARWVGWIR